MLTYPTISDFAIFAGIVMNFLAVLRHSSLIKKLESNIPPGTANHVYDDLFKYVLPEIEKMITVHNQPNTAPLAVASPGKT